MKAKEWDKQEIRSQDVGTVDEVVKAPKAPPKAEPLPSQEAIDAQYRNRLRVAIETFTKAKQAHEDELAAITGERDGALAKLHASV